MQINDLKNRLTHINSKISDLTNEKCKIEEELEQAESDLYLNTFKNWKIDTNTYMIWIDNTSRGYYIIKTIKVTNIDMDQQYFKAIVGDYFSEYFETHFNVKRDWISFSSLIETESSYNIYFVNEETFSSLQESLCSLEIYRNNLTDFESNLNDVSERAIKKTS